MNSIAGLLNEKLVSELYQEAHGILAITVASAKTAKRSRKGEP